MTDAVDADAPGASQVQPSPDKPPRAKSGRARPDLGALKHVLPYAARYKGRVLGAILALTAASGATLVVPVAIRRIVDFGFAPSKAGLINSYFLAMVGVAVVLAIASAARYFFVMTLGERVVSDLRRDVFRPSHPARRQFLRPARAPASWSRASPPTRRS